MLINVLFIALWLANRRNMNIKRAWRTVWTVLGVLNLVALAWNVFVLLVVLAEV